MNRRGLMAGAAAVGLGLSTKVLGDAGPYPAIPELMGRWDVSFASPQANLETVWVVEPSAALGTSIGTLGVNPVGLSVTQASLAGNRVELGGSTTLGPLTVTAELNDGAMAGTFRAGTIAGTFAARRRPDARTATLLSMFDEAVEAFYRNLFTPAPFDQEWRTRRADLRAGLDVPQATERDLVRAVRTLVAAARMSHNNYYIPTLAESGAGGGRTSPAVTWNRLENGLGLIRVDSFVEDPAERDRIDAAFAELADTKGMVLDLRGNGGGNLGLAMRLGDHLFPAGTPAGRFAARKALDAAGVATMDGLSDAAYRSFDGYAVDAFQATLAELGAVSLVTGGRAPPYEKPLALLIDGNSGSASEAMAAVLKETRRARLFGARTAGTMLASKPFAMQDGYILRVAFADFRTPGGAVAEAVGVQPDQAVRDTGAPTLAAATRWLANSG